MLTNKRLKQHLAQLLMPENFKDYCPNGLQLEGKQNINKIVSGVTINLELIERAIEAKADAIIVHHGLFWQGDDACIVDHLYQRLKALIRAEINVFAYHLPLDAHPILGNNIQLANHLAFENAKPFGDSDKDQLFFTGTLQQTKSLDDFTAEISKNLQHQAFSISRNERKNIKSLAWCSGSAASFLTKAIDLGVDAFITGEISESAVHLAKECDVALVVAGHHATERYGIKALGDHLSEKFNIEHQFIEVSSPV